jgi:hypothetical protein
MSSSTDDLQLENRGAVIMLLGVCAHWNRLEYLPQPLVEIQAPPHDPEGN